MDKVWTKLNIKDLIEGIVNNMRVYIYFMTIVYFGKPCGICFIFLYFNFFRKWYVFVYLLGYDDGSSISYCTNIIIFFSRELLHIHYSIFDWIFFSCGFRHISLIFLIVLNCKNLSFPFYLLDDINSLKFIIF